MKTCEKFMNRILAGEITPEVEQHLQKCQECRELSDLSRMVSGMGNDDFLIPDDLDKRIMAYAKSKKRPVKKVLDFSMFMRRAIMPIAATLAVCVGLVYSFQGQKIKQRRPEFSYYDVGNMNTDLLMLSSQISSSAEALEQVDAYASLNLTGDEIK